MRSARKFNPALCYLFSQAIIVMQAAEHRMRNHSVAAGRPDAYGRWLKHSLGPVPESQGPTTGGDGLDCRSGQTRAVFAADAVRSPGSRNLGIRGEWSQPAVHNEHWHPSSTAPHADIARRHFRVTHPFHPLFGREFELEVYRVSAGLKRRRLRRF